MPFRLSLSKVHVGNVGAGFALLLLPGSWLHKLSEHSEGIYFASRR